MLVQPSIIVEILCLVTNVLVGILVIDLGRRFFGVEFDVRIVFFIIVAGCIDAICFDRGFVWNLTSIGGIVRVVAWLCINCSASIGSAGTSSAAASACWRARSRLRRRRGGHVGAPRAGPCCERWPAQGPTGRRPASVPDASNECSADYDSRIELLYRGSQLVGDSQQPAGWLTSPAPIGPCVKQSPHVHSETVSPQVAPGMSSSARLVRFTELVTEQLKNPRQPGCLRRRRPHVERDRPTLPLRTSHRQR